MAWALDSSSFLRFDGWHHEHEDTSEHQKGHDTKDDKPQEQKHIHLKGPLLQVDAALSRCFVVCWGVRRDKERVCRGRLSMSWARHVCWQFWEVMEMTRVILRVEVQGPPSS